ncbi:MAG: hypothetical protein H6Q74_1069 [Firmicutes bacterium]|nr:hypothetical protein [Bacillota bacterium]
MLTGWITFVLIVLFLVFFIVYKRDMIVKIFSLQALVPTDELRLQLEKTADQVIRRLETQIAHLELLLEEADEKSELLAKQLKTIELLGIDKKLLPEISVQESVELYSPPDILPVESSKEEVPSGKVEPASIEIRDGINNDKRQRIIAMADQGYTAMEIAKATGLGKGAVNLLLQLNKK